VGLCLCVNCTAMLTAPEVVARSEVVAGAVVEAVVVGGSSGSDGGGDAAGERTCSNGNREFGGKSRDTSGSGEAERLQDAKGCVGFRGFPMRTEVSGVSIRNRAAKTRGSRKSS
jgi:hypothetical protein